MLRLTKNQKKENLTSIEDLFSSALESENIVPHEEPEKLIDTTPITPDAFFSNPEKMPNKFFNFLEDSAVNLDTTEVTPTFEIPKQESAVPENKTEEIEMLDFPETPTNNENNDYLNYVIKTIRDLNLDSNKVKLEEMSLPNEYHINIIIKKDDN